jgi:pimeloyl-ACP methyl ester carboxylesterase
MHGEPLTGLLGLALALAALSSSVTARSTADAAEPSLSRVKHVRVGDIRVGYRTGPRSGRPLVLITGRSATMADWDPRLLESLMRRFRIVVFDNRAVATTSKGTKAISVEQMSDDTVGLMNALRIGKAHILGWSMGGYVAQQLAVEHPSRVGGLILNATNPGGTHYKQPGPFVRKVLASNVSSPLLFALSFPPTRAGDRGAASYLKAILTQPGLRPDSFRVSPAAQAGQRTATTQWKSPNGGLWSELGGLRKRVLVADGALDVIDRGANGRRLARRIPRATHCVFAGAGHAFLFQDHKLYAATAKRFLLGKSLRRYSRRVERLRFRRR